MVAAILENNLCPPTSEAYISKTFDLDGMTLCRVVKMQFSITFYKFGLVVPNLHSTVFHDVIRN